MYRFAIRVFGCQMNTYDADRLRTALIHKNWKEYPESAADVIILVTCSIREKAEHKVTSAIGRYDLKYRNTNSPIVIFVGCMAQRIGIKMAKKFACIKLVSGPRHLGLVPDAIEKVLKDGKRRFLMDDDPRELIDLEVVPTERDNPFKAYVTITYGCDRFCSYCIVPHVRGRLQSREHNSIVNEVRTLVNTGVSEITLLGQNVDAYGKDKVDGYRFAALLKEVSMIEGLKRLRFTTSHPKDFDEDILEVMDENTSICPAINLPIQSGSDRILQAMHRGYTVEQYLSLVERIRRVLPHVSLTSDIIVGFPGETEEDFQDSYNLLKKVRYDVVHTAAYSPRDGTLAAVMENQIEKKVKARRLNDINDMQSELTRELNEEYIGRELEILLDGRAPKGAGLFQGRTNTDKVVIVKACEEEIGSFMRVRITKGNNWSLEGERI
ncbi:MAG: tRNA (N6-isopentenyl adenosine(37)-C2)-methylthiotransferase MiaB [Synergistaceae bacterium]|nr:tRNA (N6-isopentenyl adenosine(37)-C2)-methylthiotransferase MiaB [Synergistaceae bacterium]